MLLAIDVGNTDVKLGLLDRSGWTRVRKPTAALRETGMAAWLREVLAGRALKGAVCASVVPALDSSVRMSVKAIAGVEPVFLSPALNLGMEVRYRTPHTLGADRLANALGALSVFGKPVIVVDFGTATKLEAVDAEGAYLGGAILPGLETAAMSLVKVAARIPEVPLDQPPRAIGCDTPSALQSGIFFGHAGAVDSLVTRFRAELAAAAPAVATGGLSEKMLPLCATISQHEPDLTLMGLLEGARRLGLG